MRARPGSSVAPPMPLPCNRPMRMQNTAHVGQGWHFCKAMLCKWCRDYCSTVFLTHARSWRRCFTYSCLDLPMCMLELCLPAIQKQPVLAPEGPGIHYTCWHTPEHKRPLLGAVSLPHGGPRSRGMSQPKPWRKATPYLRDIWSCWAILCRNPLSDAVFWPQSSHRGGPHDRNVSRQNRWESSHICIILAN